MQIKYANKIGRLVVLNIEITHHKNIENRSQKYCPYEIHFTCREIVSAAPYLYVCADFVFSNYYLIIFVALIINLCVCVCVHCQSASVLISQSRHHEPATRTVTSSITWSTRPRRSPKPEAVVCIVYDVVGRLCVGCLCLTLCSWWFVSVFLSGKLN